MQGTKRQQLPSQPVPSTQKNWYHRRLRIPLLIPRLPSRERLHHYLDSIYETQWLSNGGPLVLQLQDRLCRLLGVQHAVATSSATIGLLVVLRALSLPKGAHIAVPSFNFPAGPQAILWDQLMPHFIDINPETLCLDINALRELPQQKIKVIMPVHTFGYVCNISAIEEYCAEEGILSIYDGASAIGSRFDGKSVAGRGTATVISLHATKILPAGEGGLILTDDSSLAETCGNLVNFGFQGNPSPGGLGLNGKLSELSAALALAALDELDEQIAARRTRFEYYQTQFHGTSVRLPMVNPGADPVLQLFPIILPESCNPERLTLCLAEKGIETRRYYAPLHDTRLFRRYARESLQGTEVASARVLCIPFYSDLKPAQQDEVAYETLRNIR
jgi:dTDP-4-amino-4,6-dideoxygalactose transaminase